MAIDQQAVLHYLEGEFGSPPFAHRGLGRVRESLILEPQGVQAHQAARVDVRLGLRQRERDALIRRERLAEALAFRGRCPCLVERLACDRQTLQADERPAVVEALHHLHETAVLRTDQVRCGYPYTVQVQRSASRAPPAEVLELGCRDAGQVQRHEEGADPVGAAPRGAAARPHHRDARLSRETRGGLLAVENVAVAVPPRVHDEVSSIGAAARLGERDRRDRLARQDALQPRLHNVPVAVCRQYAPGERDGDHELPDVVVGGAERLEHESRGDAVEPEAAVLSRQFHPEEPQPAHLAQGRPVEGSLALSLLVERREVLLAEAASDVDQRVLFRTGREVHGSRHLNDYPTVRKSGTFLATRISGSCWWRSPASRRGTRLAPGPSKWPGCSR